MAMSSRSAGSQSPARSGHSTMVTELGKSIVEAELGKVAFLEPVEIAVLYREARGRIGLHQREGRARHFTGHAKSQQQGPRKASSCRRRAVRRARSDLQGSAQERGAGRDDRARRGRRRQGSNCALIRRGLIRSAAARGSAAASWVSGRYAPILVPCPGVEESTTVAAMQLDQALHDGEAEPGTAMADPFERLSKRSNAVA